MPVHEPIVLGFHDRGRDEGELRPSLRTEQAALPHSALQLVVNFQKIGRRNDGSSQVRSMLAPVSRAANRFRSTEEGLHTCVALHRLSPEDIRGACFLLSVVHYLHLPASLGSTGITPFQRYYERSVTFRARFFGSSTGHERRSFPGS